MIISHEYKFIFIAIPKTATHAIRDGLRRNMGINDLEQVDLFQKKRLPFKSISKISHGHITAEEIKSQISTEQWNSYFKFAFVRNPFDRFISYSFFKSIIILSIKFLTRNITCINDLALTLLLSATENNLL